MASASCRSLGLGHKHTLSHNRAFQLLLLTEFQVLSVILFRPKNTGNVGTLCTPSLIDPPPALTYTWTWPSCMGPIQNAFPPSCRSLQWCSFSFWMYFHDFDPFPFGGFLKISLAVCYFLSGFGLWPSHYLQGVYKRTNYRLTCTSFENVKDKQIWKHIFFSDCKINNHNSKVNISRPRLLNLIQPMYYSENHGVSSEYLSFISRPAIISWTLLAKGHSA